MRNSLLALGALFALGCTDDDGAGSAGPADIVISDGDFSVHARPDGLTFELRRRDEVLLAFPADALQLGRVDSVDDTVNYDPWPLVNGAPSSSAPQGLEFLPVESAKLLENDERSFSFELTHTGGQRSTLTVRAEATGHFSVELVPEPGPLAYVRLRPRVDASEAFYGLGEYFDTVNHRGHARAMQLELDTTFEGSSNEAHLPVPFVIGTRGWGLFVESSHPAVFDMARSQADTAEITFGTGSATGAGLAFHLFSAEHPLDVTRLYYEVTGYPALPARWALGPWVWRDENVDQAQVENDAQTIRSLDLATSAMWIDRPYATAVNTFDFEPARFADPAAMIARLHDLGFRVAVWHVPYLDEQSDATLPLRQHAESSGYYPPQTSITLNNWGRPIDLTNPGAVGWWQDLLRRYTDLGIEGFKLDYGEDVVPGVGSARNVYRFFDGSDERTMHALFQVAYHSTYAPLLPQDGGFLLCRSGTYGDQKNVRVVWPGDLDANFARHGDPIPGSSQKYVGGLPASLVAALSLGPSGFPFYGSDTGGYRHSPPDKETFTRWFEQTALSTVMQIGTSTNDVAWEPTQENGFDAEMLDWYRRYVRLHLRLFPYEWTYAQRIAQDGRPIQRALGLAYPELGEHPSDTYLFGDALLVAPVVERDARERDVLFPPGTWFDWWTGVRHEGPGHATVPAALDVLPLFVQQGGIVPMLRPSIDTLSPTTDPALVDSYATTPGKLWVRVAPGPRSSFTVFDGAELSQADDGQSVELGSRDGTEFRQGVVFELIAFGAQPRTVTDDGAALVAAPDLAALEAGGSGFFYAPEVGGTVYVALGPGSHAVTVTR